MVTLEIFEKKRFCLTWSAECSVERTWPFAERQCSAERPRLLKGETEDG